MCIFWILIIWPFNLSQVHLEEVYKLHFDILCRNILPTKNYLKTQSVSIDKHKHESVVDMQTDNVLEHGRNYYAG